MLTTNSIDSFENFDKQNKFAESSDDVTKFDDFSSLLAAFLFVSPDAKLPPIIKNPIIENNENFSSDSSQIYVESKNQPQSISNIQNLESSESILVQQHFSTQKEALKSDFPVILPKQFAPNKSEKETFENTKNKEVETNPISEVSSAPNLETKFISNVKPLITVKVTADIKAHLPTNETVEILTELPIKPEIKVEIKPEKPIFIEKNNNSVSLSNLFREVSKDLKNNKTESTAKVKESVSIIEEDGLTPENAKVNPQNNLLESVEKITKQATSNTESFSQSKPEITKSTIKAQNNENLSVQTFDSFLSAVNKPETVEATQLTVDKEKVFEQVSANLTTESLTFIGKTDKPNILKLRLRPAELGGVEISLEKSESGKLIAHFQTESETTREILVERFDDLQNALQNAGWQVEKLEISCNSSLSAGNENRDKQSRQPETAENKSTQTDNFENVSETAEDSNPNRLVNLRA